MKNLLTYYILIFAPIGILIWLSKIDFIKGTLFLGLFLFYVFIYRTYIDGKKLVAKHVILKRDIWKLIIPGRRLRYIKELYLS